MNIGSPELAKVFEIEKPDVVNHHAAQISVVVSARDPLLDATVNGLGLLNVLECSRAAGVKKFIFISSGGAIYGEAGEERLTEDHPPAPVSPYAIHKLLGEHYLRFYGAQHGLEWTALRYSNVFGPRQNPARGGGRRGDLHLQGPERRDPRGQRLSRGAGRHGAGLRVRGGRRPGEPPCPGQGRGGAGEHRHRPGGAHARAPGRHLPDHGKGAEVHARAARGRGTSGSSCLDNAKAARVLGWKPGFSLDEGLARHDLLVQRQPMPDASQSEIGILPCPGGMDFAQTIYAHLESITAEKMEERARALEPGRTGSRGPRSIRQINLASDIQLSSGDLDEPVDQHRTRNSLVPAKYTRFPNGEFKTEILSSVRNTDIYIVQDVANRYPLQFQKNEPAQTLSVNDHLFCLLMTVDAALQAGALQVTVILPTFPYSRQHKKKGRESLSAARVGQILEYFGVTRIITLDIHSKEIENCFNHLRLENLHGAYQILKMLATVTDLKDENLMVVAPDTGAVDRSKFYASILGKPLGMLYKERDYSRVAQSAEKGNITDMKLLGSVEERSCS